MCELGVAAASRITERLNSGNPSRVDPGQAESHQISPDAVKNTHFFMREMRDQTRMLAGNFCPAKRNTKSRVTNVSLATTGPEARLGPPSSMRRSRIIIIQIRLADFGVASADFETEKTWIAVDNTSTKDQR